MIPTNRKGIIPAQSNIKLICSAVTIDQPTVRIYYMTIDGDPRAEDRKLLVRIIETLVNPENVKQITCITDNRVVLKILSRTDRKIRA